MSISGILKSSPIITRHPNNPVLTASDVPYKPALVFNAGVTKYEGQYIMMFRNDYGDIENETLLPIHTTNLGLAYSQDGIHWNVQDKPCFGMESEEIIRTYDRV